MTDVVVNSMITVPTGTPVVPFTPIENISMAGEIIDIDIMGQGDVSSGDHIEIENNAFDGGFINILAGSYLVNTDTSDEDTVIFLDNSEDLFEITVDDGAGLFGANGVIFVEGDGSTITNSGDIVGTGAAEEGVIYYDRDTDGVENLLTNTATGHIQSAAGAAIGIEVLFADSFDELSDVGVQNAFSDFPTITIINQAGGIIETLAESNRDDDAINIAGNPGTSNNLNREILEIDAADPTATVLNGIVNLTINNSGLIQTLSASSSDAAINIEDDAIFNGTITNNATGVIVGEARGIRITDVVVEARDTNDAPILDNAGNPITLFADHMGTIINDGVIAGATSGSSTRGIDLEGDGITITNNASGVISGSSRGIEVGNGGSGENNVITNAGTISGSGTGAVDATNATGILTFTQLGGGVLDGDFLGSTSGTDLFTVDGAGVFELTDDILQDVAVTVAAAGTLAFDGNRTIDGDLTGQGTLDLDLSETHTLTGDLDLVAASTVILTDTTGLLASAVDGDVFTLITVAGTGAEAATLDISSITLGSGEALDLSVDASGNLIATFTGASGPINGSGIDDTIVGTAGDDIINGFVGEDTLTGGAGEDILNGGADNDVLNGGNDDDLLNGQTGDDVLNGGQGVDTLNGNAGDDMLFGGLQGDTLSGGGGNDTLNGDAGDDTISGAIGDDIIDGGLGIDTIFGGAGNDTIDGNGGNDIINAGGGDDTILGGDGDDTINGAIGIDNVTGGDGNDIINGNNQNDILFGNAGDDTIDGGAGNDTIDGGIDDDMLTGGTGQDMINGNSGTDFLFGNSGGDDLFGGAGIDTLDGGGGNDDLNGGAGADTFVFVQAAGVQSVGVDRIQDFEDGIDVIDLSSFDLASSYADVAAVATQFGTSVRLEFNPNNIIVLQNFDIADLDASDFFFG